MFIKNKSLIYSQNDIINWIRDSSDLNFNFSRFKNKKENNGRSFSYVFLKIKRYI